MPSYFQEYGGYFISAAINKYVYVATTRPHQEGIYLKYSKFEHVKSVGDVSHPIIREVLKLLEIRSPQIEITSLADIPAGTGLGSSGSFTTSLIKSLYTHYRRVIHPNELAELACRVEIEKLQEPIGKQDQYIAAYGGITEFVIERNGSVLGTPLPISVQTLNDLEDNLVLFFTGTTRSASEILRNQDSRSKNLEKAMIENLHVMKEIGFRTRAALVAGRTSEIGTLMHEHWKYKKERTKGISNSKIDSAYKLGISNGAVGGKIVGAGGGGFLLFYAEDKDRLRNSMQEIGFPEVRFSFDFEGTKVMLS